jgi:hypothetical protein
MATTLKDAYVAAAKVAEDEQLRKDAAKDGTWDKLWSDYRTKLDNAINKQENIITTQTGILDKNIQDKKAWIEKPSAKSTAEKNLIDLQAELKTMKLALEGVEKAYNLAKINYDKIMEYVQSVGAEFVIPVSAYDINSLLGNTIDLLDNLGIDVGAIVNGMVNGGAAAGGTGATTTITINNN